MVDFLALVEKRRLEREALAAQFPNEWMRGLEAQRSHAERHLTDAKVAMAFTEIDHSAVIKSLEGIGFALGSIQNILVDQCRYDKLLIPDHLVPLVQGVEPVLEPEALSFESLTRDQRRAFGRIERWAKNRNSPYFVLRGHPGTGKTYLMRYLLKSIKGINWIFTAPTNKAAKELGNSLGEMARTTFSALGLRMSHDEDELVMDYGKTMPYFPKNSILVVDEASMVNDQLMAFIERVRKDHDILVLYVGDPNQRPPVGQIRSNVWYMVPREFRASLREVKRYDNEILAATIRIRHAIRDKNWISPLYNDIGKDGTGVHVLNGRREFVERIRKLTNPDDFIDQKVIAWTNRTVERYNGIIRESFDFVEHYEKRDRIMLAKPFQEDDQVIAHIDDEFVVRNITTGVARAGSETIDVIQLEVSGDQNLLLKIPMDQIDLDRVLSGMATDARRAKGSERRVLWDRFWETDQNFHKCRYGYALTGHRVQGSTVRTSFVDQQDILRNENKEEAFRGLMVGTSRPTTDLITF